MSDHQTDKDNWIKLSDGGEKYELMCAICSKSLGGRAWRVGQRLDYLQLVGYACANCGFAVCRKGHRKQLKAMGVKSFKMDNCPVCGTLITDDNYRLITHDPDEFEYREGLCMTCGAEEPLQKVTVWSGVKVVGQISPDISWMGLVVLIPGEKEKKIVDVQSHDLDVCAKCARGIKPELYVEELRKDDDPELNMELVTQMKPFDKVKETGRNI